MKKLVATFAVASLVALGGAAIGQGLGTDGIGTIDPVPAATLLVPYFEVDLDSDQGITTLFSINNASAVPAVAHVVLWTDFSVPTLDFDIFLTGYDVQTVNIRDIFNGILPATDVENEDNDVYSPGGPNGLGIWDNFNGQFPTCAAFFPFKVAPTPTLRAGLINHIKRLHRGLSGDTSVAGFGDGDTCAGAPYGDNTVRGYITIDVVSDCNLLFPDSEGYFAGEGEGVALNENVLWGDYFYVDPTNNFAQGNPLVHIQADGSGELDEFDAYTFYERYVNGSGADDREPLGTTYAVRYLWGAGVFDGTDYLVWRDSKVAQGPFECGDEPFWWPLNETEVVAFDEEENAVRLCRGGETFSNVSPPDPNTPDKVCFPLETQRVGVGVANQAYGATGDLDTPFNFGWMFLNLNTDTGTDFDGIAQSWVSVVMAAQGRFSVGFDAIQLDNTLDYHDEYDDADTPRVLCPEEPCTDDDIPLVEDF